MNSVQTEKLAHPPGWKGGGNMNIMLTSKTVDISERLKGLIEKKFLRLKKFTSLQIEHVSIVVDRVKRKANAGSDAKLEVSMLAQGKHYGFQVVSQNFQTSLAQAYEKVEKVLRRKHREKTSKKSMKP